MLLAEFTRYGDLCYIAISVTLSKSTVMRDGFNVLSLGFEQKNKKLCLREVTVTFM